MQQQRINQQTLSQTPYTTEAQEAQDIFEHTNTVLSDKDTFSTVVSMVFYLLRGSREEGPDGVRMGDLQRYFKSITEDEPSRPQVNQVFRAMDLNDDKTITIEELQIFLRHILGEHRRAAEEKITKSKQQDIGKSKQAAVREVRERWKQSRVGATNIASKQDE